MGYGGVLLLRRLPIISDIGVRLTFELDRRVIAVGLVLAATSALLSSLVPAWRASQATNLAFTLRSGGSNVQRRSRLWGRNGLVAGQIGLALDAADGDRVSRSRLSSRAQPTRIPHRTHAAFELRSAAGRL